MTEDGGRRAAAGKGVKREAWSVIRLRRTSAVAWLWRDKSARQAPVFAFRPINDRSNRFRVADAVVSIYY